MSRLVQATCRYLFLVFGWAGPDRRLVAADHAGQDDQRPDGLVRRRDRCRRAGEQSVHPPVGGPGARHRPEDVRAPLDRDMVHHHQEHAPGLEVQPVRHGARRAPGFRRGTRDMHLAARALHLMPVVLDGFRACLGQVGDLVGVPDPEITGPGQVPAAPAGALREVRDCVVRVIAPRQVRPWRPGLLARSPLLPALPLPGLRRFPPGLVVAARRHRGVAAVTGDQPLQPGDLLRLLR